MSLSFEGIEKITDLLDLPSLRLESPTIHHRWNPPPPGTHLSSHEKRVALAGWNPGWQKKSRAPMSFQQAVLPLLDVCWTSFLWGIYMEYPINGVWLPRLFLVLFSGGIFSIVCLRLSYCPQQKSGLYILFMAHELKSAHHPAASCSFSSFARYLLKVEQNMVISAASLSSLITKLITPRTHGKKYRAFFSYLKI